MLSIQALTVKRDKVVQVLIACGAFTSIHLSLSWAHKQGHSADNKYAFGVASNVIYQLLYYGSASARLLNENLRLLLIY